MTRFAPDAGQHDILDDLGLCNAEREMQRFVTVTIVAPLTHSSRVTPRDRSALALIPRGLRPSFRHGHSRAAALPLVRAGPEIRSGINLSASGPVSASGRAHGNKAFMRMIFWLLRGRDSACQGKRSPSRSVSA
jgi:hypothetical protein